MVSRKTNSLRNRKTLAIASTIFAAFILLFATVVLPSVPTASAAPGINRQVNFQGKVVNANGTNVPDASYSFRFRIYSSTAPTDATNTCSANSCLWEETKNITTVNGIFQTNLGDTTAFTGAVDFTDDSLHLAVRFNADTEMSPRIRLTAVPYAFNAERLGGLAASSFAQLSPGAQQTGTVNVSGDINSAVSISVGGTSVCTASGCTAAAGSANYIQNSLSSQVANFNIQSGAAGSVGGIIRGAEGQTANLLQLQGSNGTAFVQFHSNGSLSISPGGNNGNTLQIRSAGGGASVFNVDTTNGGNVNIGTIFSGAKLTISTVAQGAVGQVIRGVISQTADLLQLQDSTGTVLSSFDASGNLAVQNTTIAAGKSITMVGGITATRPASPTEGMLYYDTTTKQLLTYTGSKWQADRSSNTVIVGTSAVGGTSTAVASKAPDGADFVNTSDTSAQTVINSAIAALPATGGSVYLMEGTYIVDGSINLPNNTTLVGAGAGTIIKLKNAHNVVYNLITNTDTTTGVGVTVTNLTIDGNRANQTLTTYGRGISFSGLGGGSGATVRSGATITGLTVRNIAGDSTAYGAVYIDTSANNTVANNTFANSVAGVNLVSTTDSTVTGNVARGNGSTIGFGYILNTAARNTVTGNVAEDNASSGILLIFNADDNVVIGNTVTNNLSSGISLRISSNNNVITGNKLHSNGGATTNEGIFIDASDANTITGNAITDTSCTTNCYAINISNSTSDNNYLADNRFSTTSGTATINDLGTGTVYANQSTAANGGNLVVRTADSTKAFSVQRSNGSALMSFDTANDYIIDSSVSTAYNLLTNPSFEGGENSASGWLSSATGNPTIVTDAANARTGNKYLRYTANGNHFSKEIAVTPGDKLYLEIYTKRSSGGTRTVALNVLWLNTDGTFVSLEGSPACTTTTTYSVCGYTFTAPAGAAKGSVGFNVNSGSGTLFLDDAYASKVNQQGPQLFKNSIDSATALRIQNASGTDLLTANTANQSIGIGISGTAADLLSVGGTTGNFRVNTAGAITAATGIATTGDFLQSGAGTFGTGTGVVSLNGDVTVAAGKSISLVGGITSTRPASPTPGMLYYDTTTNTMLQYNGSKWVSDRTTSTKIVAASTSSQSARDGADYVTDGENSVGSGTGTIDGDQIQINQALDAVEALGGGSVYLTEGTYTVDGPIRIPNNTTLMGAGAATLIQLGNFGATSVTVNVIENKDTTTGTRVTINDLRIDGRNSINTSGTQSGIYLTGMGAGSGSSAREGARITNVTVRDMRNIGVDSYITSNNTITGNTVRGNLFGLYISSSSNNTITDNTVQGNSTGMRFQASSNNTVTGNTVQGNSSNGIHIQSSSNNTVTGNTVQGNSSNGIHLAAANSNVIAGNKLHDNGGTGATDTIFVGNSDANTITGNDITDTAGTGFAINISDSTSDLNYLADNRYSGTGATSINDAGTGTIYANQLDGSGNLRNSSSGSLVTRLQSGSTTDLFQAQDSSGNSLFRVSSTGTLTLGRSNGASGTTGVMVIANAANNNTVTIASGTTTSSYQLTLPPALGASGDCLKDTTGAGVLGFGTCGGAGGAATSLNNLAGVAINTSLLPGVTNSIDAGSAALGFRSGYFATSLQAPLLQTADVTGASTALTVRTGNSTTSGATGALTLSTGSATSGNSGNITLSTGTASGTGGSVIVRPGKDSTTAFQIQNAAGSSNLFIADTFNTRIGIGTASLVTGSVLTANGSITITGTAGQFRAPSNGAFSFRNNANTYDMNMLSKDTSDHLYIGDGTNGQGMYFQNAGGIIFSLAPTTGAAIFKNASNSATAFQVQNANGDNALSVNTSNLSVTLADTTIAAGKSITMVGGITATRPASPTEGMLYYDTTTKQLLVYANGKWQADRSTSTVIVGTSAVGGTSTAVASKAPAGADFVNTSTTSAQTVINSAIAALPATGGSVYLMEGTYIIDGSISLPNNTTLVGAGAGTVIKFKNGINVDFNGIVNADTTTGERTGIKDLRIDGNESNQTAGIQRGIYLLNVGTGDNTTVRDGAKIFNILVKNVRSDGIWLEGSVNGIISGNTVQKSDRHGITLSDSHNNNVSGNIIQGNGGRGVNITGGAGSLRNNIVGNNILANGAAGVRISLGVHNSVNGNNMYNNGAAAANNAVILEDNSDNNTVTDNDITDSSCTTTCYAIDIRAITEDNNYLADNRHSATGNTSTIQDLGTGTIYANQLNEVGSLINRSAGGTVVKLQTGSTNDLLQLQGSDGIPLAKFSSTGQMTIGLANVRNGTIHFRNSSNANTITLISGTTAASYNLVLPTAGATGALCLKSTSGSTASATDLEFGTCGSGGASSLQGAYDGGSTINLASNTVQIRDNASPLATAFAIQNSSGSANYLTVSSTAIRVGAVDTIGTLLVLDTKTTAGDPAGEDGGMYYNSSLGKFRCYENGNWKDCNARTTVRLSADVVNNNATANTIQNVTGLTFPVTANAPLNFACQIAYTSAATTTGSRWAVTGPTLDALGLRSSYSLTATTQTLNFVTGYNLPAASNLNSIAGTNLAILEGIITTSATGTVQVTFASEIASSAITAKTGSTCTYW